MLRATRLAALLCLAFAGPVWAQTDPGPRGGPAAAGGPLHGLTTGELAFFKAALAQFQSVDSVSGTLPGESGGGLGPRFNGNVCSACHAYPAPGGASPPVNPQIAMATRDGATNTPPAFLTIDGPVREARFRLRPDGTPDGRVHPLFTIAGRIDAPGCNLAQPDFQAEMNRGNVALRIPTSVFGLGLVENVSDSALRAAVAARAAQRASLQIHGHFNHDPNDASISRFGWKAQDKSLMIFAGEAYAVEQGVTNELFPNELSGGDTCHFNALPEDATFFHNTIHSGSPASDLSSGTTNFATFMRLTAAPAPAPMSASATAGAALFVQTGCEACHISSLQTSPSIYAHQSGVTIHPFSDFQLHRMGAGLADGITQGSAGGEDFRTAPLWGIGQRLFFLHDGRARDLVTAIDAHAGTGSEANIVIRNFHALGVQDRQAILDFLRAL